MYLSSNVLVNLLAGVIGIGMFGGFTICTTVWLISYVWRNTIKLMTKGL